MYLALLGYQLDIPISRVSSQLPFRLSSLLLDLRENAFCLVIFAVGTFGQFCIALDFLLTAHITGLQYTCQHTLGTWGSKGPHSCDPPTFCVISIIDGSSMVITVAKETPRAELLV